MRRIIHLSDIHFGAIDPTVTELVVRSVNELRPHVVAVSGDLTQRARTPEFVAARAFLDRLPGPQIVVPGNHDVPLYNVYDRFFRKYHKFQRYISKDLNPSYVDEELAIVGINTARALVVKGGRINDEQMELVRSTFCSISDLRLKMVVTHHPFDLPEGHSESDIVGRAAKAFPLIADCGGDVFLSGHMHVSNIDTSAKRYRLPDGRTALVVQAGTATSTRVRGEAHSFNLLEYEMPAFRIVRYECTDHDNGFIARERKLYKQVPSGWEREI